jgi:hypothetical protein
VRCLNQPADVDTYGTQLHRVGWSVGEHGGAAWTVEAHRPGVRIPATAPMQAQAWRLAWQRSLRYEPRRS